MVRLLLCTGLVIVFGLFYPRLPAPSTQLSSSDTQPPKAASQLIPCGDAVTFLEECLKKYDQTVKGYRVTLYKHEKVQNRLRPPEVVEADFREKPFSVLMRWKEGAGMANAVLYVEGQNHGKMKALANPSFLGVWDKAVNSVEARQTTRYTADQFGIRKGTERVLDRWRERKAAEKLTVHYLGIQPVPELDGRRCHILHRADFPPEEDGIEDVLLCIDEETWLQLGSVLLGKKLPSGQREVVGKYFFRNLELNPSFPPEAFAATALRKPWNPR